MTLCRNVSEFLCFFWTLFWKGCAELLLFLKCLVMFYWQQQARQHINQVLLFTSLKTGVIFIVFYETTDPTKPCASNIHQVSVCWLWQSESFVLNSRKKFFLSHILFDSADFRQFDLSPLIYFITSVGAKFSNLWSAARLIVPHLVLVVKHLSDHSYDCIQLHEEVWQIWRQARPFSSEQIGNEVESTCFKQVSGWE